MSRIGKMPVILPDGVTVTSDNKLLSVKGPKGTLNQTVLPHVAVKLEDKQAVVSRDSDEKISRANHGLMRALLNNMVTGVSKGFEKKLEVNGVGYRVQLAGQDLKLNLGFSHDVIYKIPEGVNVGVEQNIITVTGADKQKVGQAAAEIRSLKKPEPYKGKGIKYIDERILRKSGKSGKEA